MFTRHVMALGPLGRFVGGSVYWLNGIPFEWLLRLVGTRYLAAQPFAALLHSSVAN